VFLVQIVMLGVLGEYLWHSKAGKRRLSPGAGHKPTQPLRIHERFCRNGSSHVPEKFTTDAFGTTIAPSGQYGGVGATGAATTVTDPHGKIIGADPDARIRFELRRDYGRGF
jgi:hypothetical protein